MGMESARRAGAEELLRHQAFLRRLAHELVRDAARADDLVQEAWLQALERPPRVAAAARTWFRAVLRNLAGRAARADGRRARREAAAARPEAQPGPLEIGERLASEQLLVQAVEALREPYRSAIFLRYFENLTPRAIAAREGAPVATVKTRLRRGLELLREALDDSRDRRTWALGLVGLARAKPVSVPVVGALLGVGLALGGALLWLLERAPDEREGPRSLLPVAEASAAEPGLGEVTLVAPIEPAESWEGVRTADTPEPPTEAAPDLARAPTPTNAGEDEPLQLRGRVLFPDRRGAEGASVAFGPFATSCGPGGWFELALDEEEILVSVRAQLFRTRGSFAREDALVAWHDGWVPVVRRNFGVLVEEALGGPTPGQLAPVELVLASRSLEIRGTLLDRTGAPATGWRFALLDGELVAKGDYRPFSAEDLASGTETHQTTGDDGSFAFRGLAPEKSYRVRAWHERTLEQVVSPPIPAGTLDVLLRAPGERWRAVVDGVVVGLDGTPLPDVRCRLSMNEYRIEGGAWMNSGQDVRTDAAGRFAFVDVPPAETFIRFSGYGSGTELELLPDAEYRGIRVELVRSAEFHFESSTPPRAQYSVCVLDEVGKSLPVEVPLSEDYGRSRTVRQLPLSAEGTARARVSELARWLVVLEGERELARLPLTIQYGEVAHLRW
jgi:RNA polymerase sigma-70 factor (ECF subfamily)